MQKTGWRVSVEIAGEERRTGTDIKGSAPRQRARPRASLVAFSSRSREVIGNNAINSRTLGERKGGSGFFPIALSFLGDTNRCRITDTLFKRNSFIPLRRPSRSLSKGPPWHPLEKKGARLSRQQIRRKAYPPAARRISF